MNTPIESAQKIISSLNNFSEQESPKEDITLCKYYEPTEINSLKQSKNKQHLNSLHLNIQSIFSHIDDLQTLLTLSQEIKFDVIGLTETRIKKGDTSYSSIDISGYVSESCPTESTAGGALLYISNKLNYKPRNNLKIYQKNQLESIFIEIINKKAKNVIVGCIYRHPCMQINDFNQNFLTPLLEKISFENKEIILMGDFNINLLKHNQNTQTAEFLDNMTSNGLIPQITNPTRITVKSKTIIDNIFTNITHNKLAGNITTSISDHLPQFLLIEYEHLKRKQNKQNISKRNFKNFDKENFILDLLDINWDITLKTNQGNVNFSFDALLKTTNDLLDQYAPIQGCQWFWQIKFKVISRFLSVF